MELGTQTSRAARDRIIHQCHPPKRAAAHPFPIAAGRQVFALVVWLVFCCSASATAVFVSTGGWYGSLRKPLWNPPAWVFAPAWAFLYVTMAIAAWLVWREGGWKAQRRALGLFLLQWLLNGFWTPLFFGWRQYGFAFAEIITLWLALAATLILFWRVKWTAGALLAPYLAWVPFAAALNFAIWRLNS